MSAWPIHSWIARIGAPAAAIWVANVAQAVEGDVVHARAVQRHVEPLAQLG